MRTIRQLDNIDQVENRWPRATAEFQYHIMRNSKNLQSNNNYGKHINFKHFFFFLAKMTVISYNIRISLRL